MTPPDLLRPKNRFEVNANGGDVAVGIVILQSDLRVSRPATNMDIPGGAPLYYIAKVVSNVVNCGLCYLLVNEGYKPTSSWGAPPGSMITNKMGILSDINQQYGVI